MRRILLLITDLQIGGTPTVVRELAIRLNAAGGAEVEVACLSQWGPVADRLQQAGIRVTALDAKGAGDFPLVVWRLARLIRQRRSDTVFSFLVHANVVAAAASRICSNVRWLQSIQTTQPMPRWHWKMQAVAQHAAERIVVPSPSVARVASEWTGLPAEKIVVIPNAVDLAAFREPNEPLQHGDSVGPALADADGREVPVKIVSHGPSVSSHRASASAKAEPAEPGHGIGFIGRLDPVKRIPDLLEAMTHLDPAVHLHLFGEGAQRQQIEAERRRLGLESRVTLHGAVAVPQEALAKIDLLVLPSQAEGFGLVLIEAMAAKVPVVATNVPGICDVVRNEETGLLVPVASPAALAEAIAALLRNRPLRERLIANGMDEVRRRFSWDVVLPRYRSLLGIPK